ncbi:aminotransferase [Microbacterium hominis]|uniref:Aminotransferase n=1 Tax=Microbacterium hominis TaxID=162426 RepID=A0A7D4PTM3_9MICO|nr:aminotransferase [Microbacterium hominis]QKJ18973.1 aminotransferase [Microbacterium hominis]
MSAVPPRDGAALIQPAPPEISPETASLLARDEWGVDAAARALGSHQDRNFLLSALPAPLLLKIANPSVSAAELEAQSAAAARIAAAGIRAPRALAVGDATARPVEVDGVRMHARLLEFLEGETLSGDRHLTAAVVDEMGSLAARVDRALEGFTAAGAERTHQWDLRHAPDALSALLPHVADAPLRDRLDRAAAEAWAAIVTVADDLPVQFIHGDLTDDNVVSGPDGHPDGVIDLGDLNRSWTVGELAITLSSLLHHDGVDLAAALRAVAAYHRVRPLSPAEAEALWPLLVLRGATLVASAHHVLATDAGNAYAAENLAHEMLILDAATSVPLPVGTALVRAAIGDPPAALDATGLVVASAVEATGAGVADLSPSSPALKEDRWLADDAEAAVFAAARAGGGIAVARFDESRLTRSALHAPTEPANVALGLELVADAGMPVRAPWRGIVSARADDEVVLTAHGLDLRVSGVRDAPPAGTDVAPGARLGDVGGSAWFSLSRAGVTLPRFVPRSQAAAWRVVAADPAPVILGAHAPAPAARPDAASLLDRRSRAFADVQEHYFADPPVIVRGWREHLIDADGRVYLDTLNNVTSVGHAHPRIVSAVAEQWSLINTNSRFHYPAVVEFAERLAALAPDPLDTVFLVNSGSEAVDLALRLAQAWSGRLDVVAMREAYHGWTYLTDAVSTSVADNPAALETRPAWVHTVAAPNTFRGAYAADEAHRYAEDAVAEIGRLAAAGTPAGAFLAETFYGNAGGMVLPDGYLAAVYAAVREHGGLAVADEVQVGYGRLGRWFWGFEQQDAVPDVIAVAKAMGDGHPLGAVITTREIAERYRAGGYFFSSAGGSPVSSVVGLTVLDIIRDERLQENARDVGEYLVSRLEELGQRHPLIGAVHGAGLYLGPEFVRDRATWEPATAETAAICDRLRALGVIAQPTGDHQNILKIKPPLCFTRASADALVDALDRVLSTGW